MELRICINVPKLSLPRNAVKMALIGALLGAMATGAASNASYLRRAWARVFDEKALAYTSLSRRQLSDFERALRQAKITSMHKTMIVYSSSCRLCAADANEVAKRIEQTQGLRMVSMSAQSSESLARGITLRVFEDVSTEDAEALKTALVSAQIPFTIGKLLKDADADFSFSFNSSSETVAP